MSSQFHDAKRGPIATLTTSLPSLRLMQIGELFTAWPHRHKEDRAWLTKA